MSLIRWLGQIEIGDRWACWRGITGDSESHRHFSAQAVFSTNPVVVVAGDGSTVAGRCILIEPLVPHRIEQGVSVELVFAEPPLYPVEIQSMLRTEIDKRQAIIMSDARSSGYWPAWLAGPSARSTTPDPRIARAVLDIDSRIGESSLRMEVIAGMAGLSAERFRHLFATEMGTPFRRYVLWRRLVRAAGELTKGSNVTEAAYAAGFADAAHFARSLKSTFGVRATQALVTRD